jgi:hypothetical protein
MTDPNSLGITIAALLDRHNPEVLKVAAMVNLSKKLLEHYAAANAVDLAGTIKTLEKCVESHLIDQDIHPRHLQAALQDLQNAGIAVEHL